MTTQSTIEVLKAHLAKEGLVLCRANDTAFPLDGFNENEALGAIVDLLDDTSAIAEFVEDTPTKPIPAEALAVLRATEAVS